MKVAKYESYTEILPTKEEVEELCRAGDLCIWLVNNCECMYYNRPDILVSKHRDGDTVGKRDGCDKVRSFDPSGIPPGTVLSI